MNFSEPESPHKASSSNQGFIDSSRIGAPPKSTFFASNRRASPALNQMSSDRTSFSSIKSALPSSNKAPSGFGLIAHYGSDSDNGEEVAKNDPKESDERKTTSLIH